MQVELHDGQMVDIDQSQFELLFGYYFHPNPPEKMAPKLAQIKCFHIGQRSIDEIISDIKSSPAYLRGANKPTPKVVVPATTTARRTYSRFRR